MVTVHDLIQDFRKMIQNRHSQQLDAWLTDCNECGVSQFQRFANGIKPDLKAVRNGVGSVWSNGQTEGQINRLKYLKRKMYGRAKFDLLGLRILHAV